MIGYVMVGTRDLARATRFYDELFTTIGGKRVLESDRFVAWAKTPGGAALTVTLPWDGEAATAGNGVMVAIAAESRDEVDALHARALALGATDEGAPGPRADTFYAGYFRDLDGNKLNAYFDG